MAKSIVKEAKVSEFNGKKSYSCTLEDGITGYYDAKLCGELKQGDPVEYTVEEKTNKKGGKYNLLTLTKGSAEVSPASQPSITKHPVGIKSSDPQIVKMKYDTIIPIMGMVNDAWEKGKIERNEYIEWFNELLSQAYGAVDEIVG